MCIVGGIYTVLKTKATAMIENVDGEYILIGPLNSSSLLEVEPCDPPTWMESSLDKLRNLGICVLFGTWLIDEGVPVVLLDIHQSKFDVIYALNYIKEEYHIPLRCDEDECRDAIKFGYLVFLFLKTVRSFILM